MPHTTIIASNDKGFLIQVEYMVADTCKDGKRQRQPNAAWNTPIGCALLAQTKLGRIMALAQDGLGAAIYEDTDKSAEEAREAAAYMIRLAQLLEERAQD